jgi:hypothetical protein
MCGRQTWTILPVFLASLACTATLAAQGPEDACSLLTDEEFQQAYGINPQIGIIPSTPELTEVTWGQHCDYADGSIDLFTTKSPTAELDRVLGLTKATKRTPVPGVGDRAFFTVVYPGDVYRERGFLAIHTGSRLVALSMDHKQGEPVETTRPKLEALAKLALPRLK